MTVKLKEILSVKDNVPAFKRGMRELLRRDVLVGIPDEKAGRNPDPGDDPEINNAMIGMWMEMGVPEANIPARPHLVPGIRMAMPKIEPYMIQAARYAMTGDVDGIMRGLGAAGMEAKKGVQAYIGTASNFQRLSDYTLAMRRARGRTGTAPLIDTTQYRNSQTYVVRVRGGRAGEQNKDKTNANP